MGEDSVLKSLSRETKALIVVSEFEAKRMPMFQLRSVLKEIVNNQEEQKIIIDFCNNVFVLSILLARLSKPASLFL